MENSLERYWLFGMICLGYAAAVLLLLLRRRVTLQSSLIYLLLLLALGVGSVFMTVAPGIPAAMGFELPSNFFFTASIGGLAFLYLTALTTISRLELRSITMVQEVALIQEELDRNEALLRDIQARLPPSREP
jgi:Uncharacterized conserved protein (DUF2304)